MAVSLVVSLLLATPTLAAPQAPPLPLLEDAPLWEMPADAAFPLPVYPFVPTVFETIGQEYSYLADDWTHLLAPGDIDGDGLADLIVEIQHEDDFSFASGDMRLYLGGKAGLAATPATERFGLTGEVRPIGDIDDDGRADIVVCSQYACDLYLGDATGLAETPIRTITTDDLGVVNDYHYIYGAVGNADFDGDGIGDFALFDTSEGLAIVFGATDTDELRFVARDDFTTLWALGTVPDIDDDGDDEVVVFTTFYDFENEQQTELHVLSVSDDAQSIEDHSAVDLELGGGANAELRAADFDGDGQAELIYADAWDDWGNGIVKVYGWGGDAWDLVIELDGTGLVDYPSIRCFGRRITTGDLDGDGIADLAVGSRAFLDLLVGGAGGLQPFATDVLQAVIIPDDENILMGDVALELAALGDVDGDGDDDLAAFGYDFVDGEHFPFVRLHAGGAAGCAEDADHDGVCDDDDNCPTFNPAQEDDDDNGVGNVCDFPGSDSSGGEETSSSGGPSAESSSSGGGDETTGSTSGHADGSGSETNVSATLGDDSGGSSSDTDGDTAGMNAGDGGCGCHSSGSGTPLGVLLMVVACVVRRRARLQTWVLAAGAGGCNDPSGADQPAASSTGESTTNATGASESSSSGGIAGGICCAADSRSLVDCGDAHELEACAEREVCHPGLSACVDLCTAAIEDGSAIGCEHYAAALPQISADVGAQGGFWPIARCTAALVINPSPAHARMTVERDGEQLDLTDRLLRYIGLDVGIDPVSGDPVPVAAVEAVDPELGIPPFEAAFIPLAGSGCAEYLVPGVDALLPRADEDSAVLNELVPGDPLTPLSIEAQTGIVSAFRIVSDVPVVVHQFTPFMSGWTGFTGGSYLSPTHVWGNNFVVDVPSRSLLNATSTQVDGFNPFVAIVAQQDGTTVRILPSAEIGGGPGVPPTPAGHPIEIELDSGRFAQLVEQQMLTGSIIESDAPVAVFVGHECGWLGDTQACDHMQQMLTPVSALGSHYAAIGPSRVATETSKWRVVGAVDGTKLIYSDGVEGPSTLDRGESIDFDADRPFVIASADDEHPFALFSHMHGGWAVIEDAPSGPGDPEILSIADPRQFVRDAVFFVDGTFAHTQLLLVRASESQDPGSDDSQDPAGFAEVELDCAAPGTQLPWVAFGDDAQYEAVRIDLDVPGSAFADCDGGVHRLTSAKPFGAWLWSWDHYNSIASPVALGNVPFNDVEVPAIP